QCCRAHCKPTSQSPMSAAPSPSPWTVSSQKPWMEKAARNQVLLDKAPLLSQGVEPPAHSENVAAPVIEGAPGDACRAQVTEEEDRIGFLFSLIPPNRCVKTGASGPSNGNAPCLTSFAL